MKGEVGNFKILHSMEVISKFSDTIQNIMKMKKDFFLIAYGIADRILKLY